ncbi:MAG: trypsin-like peptidase domain-containing protein [Sphingomicrobium sp.]
MDDRIGVSAQAGSVYGPIGVLYGGSARGHATAFLVNDCHVLTVRHAFDPTGPIIGARATFAAGVSGDALYWTVTEAHVVEAGDLTTTDASASGDWALLRLTKCLGRRYGTALISSRMPRLGQRVQLAGYPNDKSFAAGLILDPDCEVRQIADDGSIKHDCATQPGNSGSPLFDIIEVKGRKRLRVLGMNNAGHSYGVTGANLRTPVTSFHMVYAGSALPIRQLVNSTWAKASLGRDYDALR